MSYSRGSSSSPVLSGDSSPFSCFTDEDGETDADMAELDLDDEHKLAAAFAPKTKYRDGLPESSLSKQVRFEAGPSSSPPFCDPFSASANSTRHPPRYAKKEPPPSKADRAPRGHEIKMRELPLPMQVDLSVQTKVPDQESMLWETTISRAIDQAEGLLDLSNRYLTYIPPSIQHMAHLVSLPTQTPSPPSPPMSKRNFNRIATAPAIMNLNSRVEKRKFDMIKSAVNLGIPASRNPDQIRSQVQLFLSNNRISHIPPELCKLNNLVVLSLRSNSLTELPSCISYLINLRDLNVANNNIKYLPWEITTLSLTVLSVHPNPFHTCPPNPESGRCTNELIVNHTGVVPLRELAIRRLIRPLEPGETHSALESMYCLPLPSPSVSGISEGLQIVLTPASSGSLNPFQSTCPSPLHKKDQEPTPLFVDPMLEQFEWVDKVGEVAISAPRIPIRWRGCSAGCLNFLDTDQIEKEPGSTAPLDFHAATGPQDQSFEFSDEENE